MSTVESWGYPQFLVEKLCNTKFIMMTGGSHQCHQHFNLDLVSMIHRFNAQRLEHEIVTG